MTSSNTLNPDREFAFESRHFERFRALARHEAGIELAESKVELVYGRLARRLRALGLDDFDAYCELLATPDSPERVDFVNAITTNVTSFFREEHHFEFLRLTALPALMAQRSSRRLRIWSAACSTGPEPYSIAMTLAEEIPPSSGWDWRILATDIDRNVVSQAESGLYGTTEVTDELLTQHQRWIRPRPGSDGADPTFEIAPSLRRLIYFRVLNLMDAWPMSGPIDAIFCRNVMIYFSKATQVQLLQRFAEILAPDGYLFIGHSESMSLTTPVFEPVGRTIYRRTGLPV